MGESIHLVGSTFTLLATLVNVKIGDRHEGFKTTTDYFQYLYGQDWQQFLQQPNSVFGPYDAKNKYEAFKTLGALIPNLINSRYNCGKFKLICDDLGLANLIVKSKDDFTVIGVVDLEWSYIGPAQLFGTAPWWLLQDRPVNPEWDVDEDSSELSPVGARYMKHLDIFISILEEEEKRMPGHEDKELSNLVKWSQESGAMWLHMLLSSGFIDDHIFPFVQLCRHFDGDWTTKKKELNISSEELEKFAARKMNELEKYDETLDRRRERLALVRSGKMSNEEFLALIEQNTPANSSALIEPSSSNNPGHVLEDTRDSAITHGSHVEGGDCYKAHD